jgi:hypothetical protein
MKKMLKSVMSGSNKYEGMQMIMRSVELTHFGYKRSIMTNAHGGCYR